MVFDKTLRREGTPPRRQLDTRQLGAMRSWLGNAVGVLEKLLEPTREEGKMLAARSRELRVSPKISYSLP